MASILPVFPQQWIKPQEFISSFSPCAEDCHPVLPIIFTAFRSFKMSTGTGLESLVDQTISVITNDGRNIVGVLKGFDQATNIILDESHERVYSTKEGVQQLVLDLYIIRGDNISVVGEPDEELDSARLVKRESTSSEACYPLIEL
ncbi:hypothetical protein CRYUN_Cryun11dG0021900 [Craigia yunnanensis]